jgi:ubiquitin C-terminal hydrolase
MVMTEKWYQECFNPNYFTINGITEARNQLSRVCHTIPKWSCQPLQIPLMGLANPNKFLCYMNAALQCLLRVDVNFTLHWLQQYYKDNDEINLSFCQAFHIFITHFCAHNGMLLQNISVTKCLFMFIGRSPINTKTTDLYQRGIQEAESTGSWKEMTENQAFGDSAEYINLLLNKLVEELRILHDTNNIVENSFSFASSLTMICQNCLSW